MPRRVLFVAPVLPVDVLAAAKILDESDLLESLITRGVSTEFTKSLSTRPASPVAKGVTEAKWIADLVFYITLALTRSRLRSTDASFAFLDRVAARRINPSIGVVLAREDCCLQTFRRARQAGIPTIYQLPTAYWRLVRQLMEREHAEFPNICQVAADANDFASERTDRKDAELECADHVLCPSSFVRESLPDDRKSAAKMIPFAIDDNGVRPAEKPSKPVFLYVGNITMRKGVHRLLMAWKELKAYRTHDLRLVGDMYLSEKFLNDFRGMFTHVPRVSRPELDRHYNEASALIFNSVADGFGHVILEAMINGVPVIASRNSGAPDVITDHVDGLLFNYGDEQEFATGLNWALSRPAELSGLGKAAAQTARKRTWKDYGEELLQWMRPLLKHD